MKTAIFYCIPNQEEKFKEYFANGAIWHNNLWQPVSKYVEILNYWQTLIKDQQANYKKISEDLTKKIKIAREKLEEQITKEELKQKLTIAYKKRAGEIPLESWETREGLEAYIKELEEQEPLTEEKKRYQSWLLNDFTFLNYQAYLKKFPQSEPWQENLTEWENSYQQLNKHDIWLIEKTQEQIVFNYQIPNNIITSLKRYLFYYLGVWYEYKNYKLTGYTRATITANYSIYWNDYWNCLKAQANGIIHNSPFLQEEVCMCPSFTQEEHKVVNQFIAINYELKLNLWRYIGEREELDSVTSTIPVSKKTNITYSQGSEPGTFPWFKVGEWVKFLPQTNSDWRKILKTKTGEVFSLVSQSYRGGGLPGVSDANLELMTGKESSFYITPGNIDYSELIKIEDWLEKNYPPELNHCRANHIWSVLYWRDQSIWQGNYWDIRQINVKETANPSGTHVYFIRLMVNFWRLLKKASLLKLELPNKLILGRRPS